MERFDLNEESKHVKAPYGVARVLAADFAECRAGGHLGSYAASMCDEVIRCILVGWTEKLTELLNKAIQFAQTSVETYEQKEESYDRTNAFAALAVCRWLRDNAVDEETLRGMSKALNAYYSVAVLPPDGLDRTLHRFLFADAYQDALEQYARSKMTPPKSPKTAKRPANVAYIVAKQRLENCYDQDDVDKSVEAMLRSHVEAKWLARGHSLQAAEWMKIAYWQPGMSAVEIVQRCQNFLIGG